MARFRWRELYRGHYEGRAGIFTLEVKEPAPGKWMWSVIIRTGGLSGGIVVASSPNHVDACHPTAAAAKLSCRSAVRQLLVQAEEEL